ncbi:cyclic nucleotide-binding domain-containing protein [Sphingopyxis terrae]|uniref:cyclic nucleotide-binding domain-containing protein n=1 Tax=Sphingopyxis terrae TaxID=33052 RepID=UPI003613984E
MPFSMMLRRFLDPQDRYCWEVMLSRRARQIERGSDLVREGDTPHFLYVVLAGWAQKYKQLQDGRRQIVRPFPAG